MDKKIDMELPPEAPLDLESLPIFFEKIMGWWMQHKRDKITLLKKVEKCATELSLDSNNLIHVSFITTTFFNTYIGIEQAKQQFSMIYQSPGKQSGQEIQ